MKHFYTSLLVVFSLTMSLAITARAQDTEAWIPFKKDPSFSSSGVLFTPAYKGPGLGEDSVTLKTLIAKTSSVTYGFVGNDLKIVLNGKTADQTVNMLILNLYDLDEATLSFDSATITYEYRSSAATHLDHGFTINAPAGSLRRTDDSLLLALDEPMLEQSRFKYWSIAMPGYTTGNATSATIQPGAFAELVILSRGKLIDSNWLRDYTDRLSCSIQGVELDMFNRYYYGDSTNITTYYLSRTGDFDGSHYSSDWGTLSAEWKLVVPNTYPVNHVKFNLTGLDTTKLHANELTLLHSYAEGGQFHYDWGYRVTVKDVTITKTESEFAIVIGADKLREGQVTFSDHIAPVHRWGSSFGFRVGNGATLSIYAKRPSAEVHRAKSDAQLIYPNPCSDHLIIASEHDTWWVINALGERSDLERTMGSRLDVSSLAGGVYLLMNGHDSPRRFVKAQ